MYIRLLIGLLFIALCTPSLLAQQEREYQPLQSNGIIPKKFLPYTEKGFEKDLNQISKDDDRQVRRIKKQFYLESNYFVNQLLMSGLVLFNDSLGNYVNQVADIIIDANPQLKDKFKIYVVKSSIIKS